MTTECKYQWKPNNGEALSVLNIKKISQVAKQTLKQGIFRVHPDKEPLRTITESKVDS